MLLMLCAALGLSALGVCAIPKGAQHVTRLLGLDPLDVLLWLGLAERSVESTRRRVA